MTATDELRRMLDERGVKWRGADRDVRTWFDVDGILWFVFEHSDGSLTANAVSLTPEQAIAATLGAGTCRITDNGPWGYPYVCSECGATFDPDVNNGNFNYCPNCGRRIEQ